MCRPHHARNTEINTSRRVVKKYRRMSLRKEMKRLRQIVNIEGAGAGMGAVSSEQVLDKTVDLITSLEERLISQIRDRGLPHKMAGVMSQMGLQWDCSLDMMREVVGQMMMQKV